MGRGRPIPIAERFWNRVDKTDLNKVGETGGCWLWSGAVNAYGYGIVSKDRRPRRAHRVAWELTHGPIPSGFCVLHRCDNPPCVNPEHLFLGSKKDNMADKIRKGRQAGCFQAGQRAPSRFLSDTAVMMIRSMWKDSGYKTNELAGLFGVHRDTIRNVVKRRYYREVSHGL